MALVAVSVVCVLCLLISCGDSDAPAPRGGNRTSNKKVVTLTPEEAAAKARKEYDTTCLTCHGKEGLGNGPGAAALDPKPRTFTDKEWQKSVTDEGIKKAIVYGAAAVGKSDKMPANPMLKNQPQVLDELVKIIRAFGADEAATKN